MAPLRQPTVCYETTNLCSSPCHFYLFDLELVTYPFWAPFLSIKEIITCLIYLKNLLERSNKIMRYIMNCKALYIIQTVKKKKVPNARTEYFRKHYNQFYEVMNQGFLFLKATSHHKHPVFQKLRYFFPGSTTITSHFFKSLATSRKGYELL